MKTVKRVPIVQQVVGSIKDYLFSGAIEEGDKLPSEKDLCEKLGVGRGTIREAFRILETTGYVEIRPGRGAFAARTKEIELDDVIGWFSEHEIETRDFNEVRLAIEPLAIKLAIQRCSEDDIERLKKIHNQFVKAVENNEVSQIIIFDEEFHTTIVEYSHNKLLVSIIKQINYYIKEFRSKTFYIPQNAKNAVGPHSEILEAFISGNPEYGEESMRWHLRHVERDLEKSAR